MDKAFCILAAGRGSRLEEFTTSMNKALLPIANKAAISHIIEKVPKDCRIVIALGYDKEKVMEYCQAAHPDRDFVFVGVDKLDGPGSGPGYSLLCCQQYLKKPFYLCNVDTLIKTDTYPSLETNWIGVAHTNTPEAFATVEYDLITNYVIRMHDKGESQLNTVYIGLLGIKDWEIFWKCLNQAYQVRKLYPEFQYVEVFKQVWDESGSSHYSGGLQVRSFSWMDIGTVENYRDTLKWFNMFEPEALGLEKNISELTYKVGGRVVKLCWESAKNLKRIHRAKVLSPHTPELTYTGQYTTAYDWIEGETLYHCQDLGIWTNFLNWCSGNLWNSYFEVENWENICHSFYFDKTWERLRVYQSSKGWDKCPELIINGYQCGSVESYLTCMDRFAWDSLRQGYAVRAHGDLQFDNVVLTSRGEFKLIDWRECFGDSVDYGDFYYDLAKIYYGIDLPYHTLKQKKARLNWKGNIATYNMDISSTLATFRLLYEDWLESRSYSLNKIKLLAALIPLNMAPLHPAPIGDVLYLHANLRLAQLHNQGVI